MIDWPLLPANREFVDKIFREHTLDSIHNEAADDGQKLAVGVNRQRTVMIAWTFLICVSASSSGHKQGRVPGNRAYQPVFVLCIRIPNGSNKCEDGLWCHTGILTSTRGW
jgi:hypothetical protein